MMRMGLKKIGALTIGALMLYLFLAGNLHASIDAPDMVIQETVDGVIARLEAEHEQLQSNPAGIYDLVTELIVPNFDFPNMSRWVLGKNWRAASKEQQQQFIEQFKTLLVRTYARALLQYPDKKVQYYPVEKKTNARAVVVKTELTSADKKPIAVTYRMYLRDDQWRVVDVIFDGVSLVSTYKGSFAAKIRQSGFDALIADLKNKNEMLLSNMNG